MAVRARHGECAQRRQGRPKTRGRLGHTLSAGLPAPGSPPPPPSRPDHSGQWHSLGSGSAPVTAARPRRHFTALPFSPRRAVPPRHQQRQHHTTRRPLVNPPALNHGHKHAGTCGRSRRGFPRACARGSEPTLSAANQIIGPGINFHRAPQANDHRHRRVPHRRGRHQRAGGVGSCVGRLCPASDSTTRTVFDRTTLLACGRTGELAAASHAGADRLGIRIDNPHIQQSRSRVDLAARNSDPRTQPIHHYRKAIRLAVPLHGEGIPAQGQRE